MLCFPEYPTILLMLIVSYRGILSGSSVRRLWAAPVVYSAIVGVLLS